MGLDLPEDDMDGPAIMPAPKAKRAPKKPKTKAKEPKEVIKPQASQKRMRRPAAASASKDPIVAPAPDSKHSPLDLPPADDGNNDEMSLEALITGNVEAPQSAQLKPPSLLVPSPKDLKKFDDATTESSRR